MDISLRNAWTAPRRATVPRQPAAAKPQTLHFGMWEEETADEDALVLRGKVEKKTFDPHKMTPEVLDYRRNFFSRELGEEFMQEIFGLDDTPDLPGAEILRFLLTPGTVDTYSAPKEGDWKPEFFSNLGKTRRQVQAFLQQKADEASARPESLFPDWFLDKLLDRMYVRGLIYRLRHPETDIEYYGVPPHVRQALKLEIPTPPTASTSERKTDNTEVLAFGKALKDMLNGVMKIEDDEFPFELAYQLARTAVQMNALKADAIPEAAHERAGNIQLLDAPPSNFIDLFTLAETLEEHETLAQPAQRLCELAIRAGLLSTADR